MTHNDLVYWVSVPAIPFVDPAMAQRNVLRVLQSDIYGHADQLARAASKGQTRKVPRGHPSRTPEPYYNHPVEVALLLANALYDPVVCASGLLHDVVEDVDGWTFETLNTEFLNFDEADRVRLVTTVRTVTKPKGVTWEAALDCYCDQLQAGSDAACALASADKISNMGSSERYAQEGYAADSYLKHGWEANMQKFQRVFDICKGRIHPALEHQFGSSLRQWEASGRRLEAARAHLKR